MKTADLYNNKNNCCGCWACVNICPTKAISMAPDNEGFLYPSILQSKCIDCKMCLQVCPVKISNQKNEEEKNRPHIGIINLQFTKNYGASIAASVLENVVKDIVGSEYTVETVNYIGQVEGNLLAKYKDQIRDAGGYIKYKQRKKNYSAPVENPELRMIRSQRFDVFNHDFLNITKPIGYARQINENANYVAFIAGSDVIWQPKRTDNFRSEGYYLKFAKPEQLKIAYAPSLDFIDNKKLRSMSSIYKKNLENLDYISVREKSNIDFIQSLTSKKVYNCCDPALLVDKDFYLDMIKASFIQQHNEKYIYIYVLDEQQEVIEYAKKLAYEKNLKICYYCPSILDFGLDVEYCLADGPCEFLYRILNAEYVLTNSFHCIVFSLLFQKQFLSFKRNNDSIKSADLLELVNLEERSVLLNENYNIDTRIDFYAVDAKLKSLRSSSLEYLRHSLSRLYKQDAP